MSRIKENNVWRCRNCEELITQPELLKAASPFDPDDELVGCPECRQCDDGFDIVCDDPGCEDIGGYGWPTGNDADDWGGYRNTCYRHSIYKK